MKLKMSSVNTQIYLNHTGKTSLIQKMAVDKYISGYTEKKQLLPSHFL